MILRLLHQLTQLWYQSRSIVSISDLLRFLKQHWNRNESVFSFLPENFSSVGTRRAGKSKRYDTIMLENKERWNYTWTSGTTSMQTRTGRRCWWSRRWRRCSIERCIFITIVTNIFANCIIVVIVGRCRWCFSCNRCWCLTKIFKKKKIKLKHKNTYSFFSSTKIGGERVQIDQWCRFRWRCWNSLFVINIYIYIYQCPYIEH